MTLLDIVLHLENRGSSTLIATNVRVDVLYLEKDDIPQAVYLDGSEGEEEHRKKRRRVGRLNFPHSIRADLEKLGAGRSTEGGHRAAAVSQPAESGGAGDTRTHVAEKKQRERTPGRGFIVVANDTFVQAGIDQQYTFGTAVPGSATYVLLWASFNYAQKPVWLQRGILWVSRRLGLIQFTLAHVTEPHTAERLLKL